MAATLAMPRTYAQCKTIRVIMTVLTRSPLGEGRSRAAKTELFKKSEMHNYHCYAFVYHYHDNLLFV